MICYKDMTFCLHYKTCKVHKDEKKGCHRALTPEIRSKADKWWGKKGAPISYFVNKPECFKEIEE